MVERVIGREFELTARAKLLLRMGFIVFMALTIAIYCSIHTSVQRSVRRQAVSSITNISQLNADSVSVSITARQLVLENAAKRLASRSTLNTHILSRDLEAFAGSFGFYNLGILDENMTLHLTDGSSYDVSNIQQYREAWRSEPTFSSSYMPAGGGQHAVNCFSQPVIYGSTLRFVIIATFRSIDLTERMNINSMGGKGFNYILNERGEVMIFPRHYENLEYNDLMSYINATPEILPEDTGDRYFTYNGERYYAHFEKLDVNDWSLMTCAREADVFAEADTIVRRVALGMGILWLIIIAAVIQTVVSTRRSHELLRQEVYYDRLTGIPNGSALPVVFRHMNEIELEGLYYVIFDIDKFKEFNYIYGDEAGDGLLLYIVKVFREELPGDYLFRYIADHFIALLHCRNRAEFISCFERVLKRFSDDIEAGVIQPFDISAGVRRIETGDTFRRVTSDALIAKGTIKGIHLQQYAFYEQAELQKRMSYMEMESDFYRALRENEFKVYYQPKYDMSSGEVIGAEALVRWVRADGSVISPGAFIPCFEASRQIILLDEYMLRSVCEQMREMEEDGLPVKKVSVNLSRVHLRHHGVLTKIERIISETGVDPSMLAFEITESALYEDSVRLSGIIDFLHSLGCDVDIDDYGVGVSSPNALAAHSFDVVKMDKSFIDGIGDERMEAVIKSTINLSKTLGMEILAEGVEEDYQAQSLVTWGCLLAQGFFYSPPIPDRDYRALLEKQKG